MDNKIIFEDAARAIAGIDFSWLEGKSVLVTGATGLLGTHFLATLCLLKEEGMKMIVKGACNSEPAEYTEEIAGRGGFCLTDDPLRFAIAEDVIIHLAGYAQPSVFTKNPAETIRINTALTQQLLDRLNPGGKFLFASSSEVYNGLNGDAVTEYEIGTTTPYHPRACYIEGKRCGETIVNSYFHQGIDARSARLSLVYGPGFRKNDQRAMCQFIRQALTENVVELKYAGKEMRSFCYVSDAVEMMWDVLLHGDSAVYNIGSPDTYRMVDIADRISYITHADFFDPSSDDEMPGAEAARMSTTRYERKFAKKSFIGLQEGLERTIEWSRGLYAV